MKHLLIILVYLLKNINALSYNIKFPKSKYNYYKFLEESEIKHGRLSMLSCISFPIIEIFNDNNPAIKEIFTQPINHKLPILILVSLIEFNQLNKAHLYPLEPKKWFILKDSHQVGDYDFDPLRIKNNQSKYQNQKNIELINGRISMISMCPILYQEIFTKNTILDNINNQFLN